MPTPAFPIRPAFAGVGANALIFHRTPPPGEEFGFPTSSGRRVMPARPTMSVLDASAVGLMVAVSQGPVCKRVTVLTFQPPRAALTNLELLCQFRPAPNGNS